MNLCQCDVLIGGAWHLCDAHVVVHIEPLRVVVHFVCHQSDTGREPKCLVEFEFPLSEFQPGLVF